MYDFIVLGAGGSGSPLAARLSEDPWRRVLLVEAGPDFTTTEEFPRELLEAGSLRSALPSSAHNWAFVADLTPQRRYSVARGRVLGGSTALNGAYFIRARRADHDRWSAAGNPEWSYENVLPLYRRLERDLTYGETAVHGGSGPMPVARKLMNPAQLTTAFYDACRELGFVEEPDKNAEGEPGYGPLPMNVQDEMRVNTGIAYINPHRGRTNLTVRGDTRGRRVIFDGARAVGVELETDGKVELVELRSAGEVILSAGAFNSPHLLVLSGIGSRAEVEALGIPVVSDLPGVGKQFSDHPQIRVSWTPRYTIDSASGTLFESVLNFTSSGSLCTGDLEILPSLSSFGAMLGLASHAGTASATPGARRGAMEAQSASKQDSPAGVRDLSDQLDNMFLTVAIQQPHSRGNLTVVSADPLVQPKVEYNYLAEDADLQLMREGVRTAVEILRTRAFKPYFERLAELDDATLNHNDALDAWLRGHLSTGIHASGTAKMGPRRDPTTVVDQYGRVHGVTGLRVADTSMLPTVPTRGPAATAVAIGERVAELIRRE